MNSLSSDPSNEAVLRWPSVLAFVLAASACGASARLDVEEASWSRIVESGDGCVTTPRGAISTREIVVDELVTEAGPVPEAEGLMLRTVLLMHARPDDPPLRLTAHPIGDGGGLIDPLGDWDDDPVVVAGYVSLGLGGLSLAASLVIAGLPIHYGGLPDWLGGTAIAGGGLLVLGGVLLLAALIARETRSPDGPRRLEPCLDTP